MFSKKIKVVPEHHQLIVALAKELKSTPKEVGYDIIEMGFMVIGMAKRVHEGKDVLEEAVKILSESVSDDPKLWRMCHLLELWWEAGGEAHANDNKSEDSK